MLNSIGLANPGRDAFLAEVLPALAELGVPIWVSVGGFSAEEYAETCAQLAGRAEVATIELNLSCPNVDEAPESAAEIVSACRRETTLPLYAKLSPAVPDVGALAVAVASAGADGLSLVNTIRGPGARRPAAAGAGDGDGRLLGTCAEADRAGRRACRVQGHGAAHRRHGRRLDRPRRARADRRRSIGRRAGNSAVHGPGRASTGPRGARRRARAQRATRLRPRLAELLTSRSTGANV